MIKQLWGIIESSNIGRIAYRDTLKLPALFDVEEGPDYFDVMYYRTNGQLYYSARVKKTDMDNYNIYYTEQEALDRVLALSQEQLCDRQEEARQIMKHVNKLRS